MDVSFVPFVPFVRRVAFLLVLPALAAAQDQAPAGKVLLDQWDLMRLGDADLGYTHQVSTLQPGSELIETRVESRLVLKRLGTTIEVEQTTVTVERPTGELVRMDHTALASGQRTESRVEFVEGEARVVTRLMGRSRERTVPCPKEVVGPYRLQRLTLEKGLDPGTQWSATTFVPDLMSASAVHTRVVGPEETALLDGRKAVLTRIETTLDELPMPITTWVDKSGVTQRTVVSVMGLQIEALAATEQRARAAGTAEGEISADVFARTLVVARDFVPHPRHLDEALLEVRVVRQDRDLALPSSASQQVAERDAAGVMRVRLRRSVPGTERAAPRPLRDPPPELADALGANTMIQSDEAEIAEIAASVVGAETDAWRAAQALERWVCDNVTDKTFDVAFASALEVCRERRGDCSEHAVLLAALCRAAGIPARVAMGLLYVGGIWGGHAWNEVWIDGAWYPLDGTLGYGSADPLHLTMSTLTLRDGELGKEFAGLVGLLGNLEIAVTEVVYGGERIALAGAPAFALAGDRYTNRLWGFACERPDGFEFEPLAPARAIGFRMLEVEGEVAGKRVRIGVEGLDAPPQLDWGELLGRRGTTAPAARAIEVDGRQGRLIEPKGRLVALVHAGPALFVFDLEPAGGEATRELLEAFLRAVDFDAPRG